MMAIMIWKRKWIVLMINRREGTGKWTVAI